MLTLRFAVALAAALLGLAGAGPADAARELVCQARGEAQTFCRVPAGSRVRLLAQLSSAPCVQNRTWGVGEHAIWVSRRCAGRFAYAQPDDPDTGAIVGGLIVGGIIGAIIGSQIDNDDRYRPPVYQVPDREEAIRICSREGSRLALARGADWARFQHVISVDLTNTGNRSVRAVMAVRNRHGGWGEPQTINRRFHCILDGRRVAVFDWY